MNAPSTLSTSSGSGLGPQAFQFLYLDPNGYTDLASLYGRFNATASDVTACSFRYDRVSNYIYLYNDAGTGWAGSGTLGSQLTNTQCTLGTGSTAPNSNNLTLNLTITFKPAFAGAKNTYMQALDAASASSGWQTKGTWTVPTGTVQHIITTSPAGLSLTVDGSPCTAPCTFQWTPGTQHTIATTLAQPPYYFSYWSDNGALSHTVTAQSTATTYTASFFNDALLALRQCLGSSTSSTCTLAAGPHTVTQTIQVTRSNVTVTGETSNRSDTRLIRDPAHTGPMMQVDAAAPLTGITIQRLTFCGNNNMYDSTKYVQNPYHSRVCPIRPPTQPTACDNLRAVRPEPPPQCVDLSIDNADAGPDPTDPFAYAGPYSVTIADSAFQDAPGHAIMLHPNAPKQANDVYIHHSDISGSAVTGVLAGVNSTVDYNDRKLCDNYPDFKNASIPVPRNIRMENNTFYNNNTGSIGMLARWVGLRHSTFHNNYINYALPGLDAGGTVFFDQCSDKVHIYDNDLIGPTTYANTSGLELWGRNITADNNRISNYWGDGIDANSVIDATITNNETTNNGRDGPTGGIEVWTAGPGGGCGQIMRDTDAVTIGGNTSRDQAYGIELGDRGVSRNVLKGITVLGNNTLQPNSVASIWQAPIVARNGGYIHPSYPVTIGPVLPLSPPRALAVDAVAPVTSRCSAGARSQVFTFAANDVLGAGNIWWVQAAFSLGGEDNGTLGFPDNGYRGCHFIYYAKDAQGVPVNKVYLNGPEDEKALPTWVGDSVVGSGGSDVSNGYCTIHAGSPNSQAWADLNSANILNLKLHITFLPSSSLSTDKRIYTITGNLSGAPLSDSGFWRYWGYWKTP